MALLNAEDFGELASVSASQSIRKPGKFFNVNICGKRRKDQQPGTYQCAKSFDGDDYFVHNENSVHFIPLYIKRVWAKYEKAQAQNGDTYDKLVSFCWNETTPKPEDAKNEYIVAGYLMNDKGIVKHTEDIDDREIKAGEPVLIYFKCTGIKCGCAYDLINNCTKAAQTLAPISNNPTFEKNSVYIRRFIIEAGITSRDTKHGAFDIFDFKVSKQLPPEVVVKILNDTKKYMKDFEYQFDKTEFVNSNSSSPAEQLFDSGANNGVDTTVAIDEVPGTTSNDDFSIEL